MDHWDDQAKLNVISSKVNKIKDCKRMRFNKVWTKGKICIFTQRVKTSTIKLTLFIIEILKCVDSLVVFKEKGNLHSLEWLHCSWSGPWAFDCHFVCCWSQPFFVVQTIGILQLWLNHLWVDDQTYELFRHCSQMHSYLLLLEEDTKGPCCLEAMPIWEMSVHRLLQVQYLEMRRLLLE